jgi:hypothetical protein
VYCACAGELVAEIAATAPTVRIVIRMAFIRCLLAGLSDVRCLSLQAYI